jgi:hypothetical protein
MSIFLNPTFGGQKSLDLVAGREENGGIITEKTPVFVSIPSPLGEMSVKMKFGLVDLHFFWKIQI